MSRGQQLFERASQYMVGGACAGGRFNPLLGRPLYVSRGDGGRFWDVDGKCYIDFFTGSGATFLGHHHPALIEAVRQALDIGIMCNGETEHHARLAQMIVEAVPCAEKVRLQNSGTEATMAALRIARAYTGRPKVLKFEGHFHGMHDYLWYNCATPLAARRRDGTLEPLANSDGMPEALAELVLVVPFNDLGMFERAIQQHTHELAAVILEPISYNQGCIPAQPDFLGEVRQICSETGIVLIFDEVLSGFRMCRGGAQEYFGITPDLCTLAKALGGGVPISAICGRSDVMAVLNPSGHTVVSGTYTGHLISVLAAIACQTEIARPGFYDRINTLGERLYGGIDELLKITGVPGIVQGIGARFGLYFGLTEPVTNYRQATRSDRDTEIRFLQGCIERGLYLHDYGHRTPMHHGYSAQHTSGDIDEALNIIEDVLREIASADAGRVTLARE